MGGQSIDDGVRWALTLFAPGVGSVLLVHLAEAQYGKIVAGFTALVVTIVVFGGVLMSLRYWHIPSTAGFLLAGGFLWQIIPNATAPLIPWPFQVLQQAIILVFFVLGTRLFLNKLR